jgi:hypothetical protein
MFKTFSLLGAFFLLFQSPMKGQSGKFLVGGKIGFSYSSDDNGTPSPYVGVEIISKTISFSGAPVIGYFFTKNFMAGIDFDFSLEKITADKGIYESSKSRSITLSPLVRFYLNSPFFAEARFIWGPANYEIDYPDSLFPYQDKKFTSRKLGFGAGMGYDIKLSEGLSLEPMIYYTRYSVDQKELDFKNKHAGIMFNLGLIYLL